MIKKAKKIISNILIIIFMILLIYITYMKIVNKSPFVKIFPISLLRISSGSMMPKLSVGEIIIILEKEDYEMNDIVTFFGRGNQLITHRIIGKNEIGFITKGDFNNTQDEDILEKEKIIGKVILHSKLLGVLLKNSTIFIFVFIFLLFKKDKRSCLWKERENKKETVKK